jgi:hypothetical protein
MFHPQEVAQLVGIIPNEVNVTSSNFPCPLMWTKKKKKKIFKMFQLRNQYLVFIYFLIVWILMIIFVVHVLKSMQNSNWNWYPKLQWGRGSYVGLSLKGFVRKINL